MNRRGRGVRDAVIFLAKLAVSVLLIAVVVRRLSWGEILDALDDPAWGWLAAALGVYALSVVGGAAQWAWILKAAGIRAPGREIRRLYFIGLFFNNFLPANIGGDAYKIVDLGRREKRSLGVLAATVLDRLLGLGALTALGVLFLTAAALARIPLPLSALALIPVLLLLAALGAFLLSRRLGVLLPRVFRKVGLRGLALTVADLTVEFATFRSRVPWLNRIFGFSLLVQLLRLATHLLVARGLGLDLNAVQVTQLMVLIPMLAVSLTLPISINGIGLREEISAKLLTWAGLSQPAAVAMELVAFLVMVIFSLQGGVLLWLGRWGRSARNAGAPPT